MRYLTTIDELSESEYLSYVKDNPAVFANYVSRNRWQIANHLEILNDKLMDLSERKIKRLLVFMPPRHGKSEFISRYFPAWYLGKHNDDRVILSSYDSEFAASWGGKVRDVINEYGMDLFGIKIRSDTRGSSWWNLKGHEGGMVTAGVGGPITGKGANLFIIDDPVKNAEEANSLTYRNRVWEWWTSTAATRLEPDGIVVVMQTRWHEDDLSGRILKEMKAGLAEGDPHTEVWEVLNFPAIADEADILGRKPGDALWPDRFDTPALLKKKKTLGSYWWLALYQQRPTNEEGNLFKRQYFRYFEITPEFYELHTPNSVKHIPISSCQVFQTCDPAASTKTTADYFVLGTFAKTPDNELLVLDILRVQLEAPDQPNLFTQGYHRWHPAFQGVESKAVGLGLFQTLLRMGLPVRELKADTDKVTRATPAAVRCEAGMVYFLSGAPWVSDFESELMSFPQGAHDDQVDVLGYAALTLVTTDEFTLIGGIGDADL